MALVQICQRCLNAFRLGDIRGQACAACLAEIAAEATQYDAKTALADDLVRGIANTQADKP